MNWIDFWKGFGAVIALASFMSAAGGLFVLVFNLAGIAAGIAAYVAFIAISAGFVCAKCGFPPK